MRVLVADDDKAIVTLLRYNFEQAGYSVSEALDGEDTLLQVTENPPNIVLLDWMLPLVSGFEVCRQLRRRSETRSLPIIMVSARGEEKDRIRGLENGADDYVVKPFSVNELLARTRAILRRSSMIETSRLFYADVEMNLEAHRVSRNQKNIHLGPTEYRLLEFFLRNPARVMTREKLQNEVWGNNTYIDERTVDVCVNRLRKSLNKAGNELFRTVRGVGYIMEE